MQIIVFNVPFNFLVILQMLKSLIYHIAVYLYVFNRLSGRTCSELKNAQ